MGRYNNRVTVRLTSQELDFIDMVASKIGGSRSDAIRIVIDMFMVLLTIEAVDVDKVEKVMKEHRERIERIERYLTTGEGYNS